MNCMQESRQSYSVDVQYLYHLLFFLLFFLDIPRIAFEPLSANGTYFVEVGRPFRLDCVTSIGTVFTFFPVISFRAGELDSGNISALLNGLFQGIV